MEVIGGALLSAVLGPVIKNIFGGDNKAQPAAPAVTPPTPMPTPGDDASRAAKRQSLAEQMARQGRASTILTDQTGTSDKLGV